MSRNHLAGIPMRRQAVGGGAPAPTYYYRVPVMNYATPAYGNSSTTFVTPGGTLSATSASTTRANTEIELSPTGTGYIKKLRCVTSNNLSTDPTVVKLWVNGVDQGATHSFTIPAGASGIGGFEMTLDDGFAVVDGSLVTMEVVRTDSGVVSFINMGFDYLTTTGNSIIVSSQPGIYNVGTGAIRYQGMGGINGASTDDTNPTRMAIPADCIIKKTSVFVESNARSLTDTNFYIRINGAGSALAVPPVPALTNGRYTATGTASVTGGDTLQCAMEGTGTDTLNIQFTTWSVELEPAVAGETNLCGGYFTTAINTNVSRFRSLAGQNATFAQSNEAVATTKFIKGGTVDRLYTFSNANTALNNTVYTIRPGGVDSSVAVTYAPGVVGILSDLANVATIADNQTVSIRVSRASGSSGAHTTGWQSLKFNATAETI